MWIHLAREVIANGQCTTAASLQTFSFRDRSSWASDASMLPNEGFITFFSPTKVRGGLALVLPMRSQIPQLIEDSECGFMRRNGIPSSLTEQVSIKQWVHVGHVCVRNIRVRMRQRSK